MDFKNISANFKQSPASTRFVACLLLIGIFFSINPTIDENGKEQIDKAFNRALITFGIARALNGVISVAQGTELAIQPAGIGINLTPGQILDPVNDIVERFSWIMLASTTALGIQKTFLIISNQEMFNYFLQALFLLSLILLFIEVPINKKLRLVILKVSLVLLVLRFAVRVLTIGNNYFYQLFQEENYIESNNTLELTTSSINTLNNEEKVKREDHNSSIWKKTKEAYKSATGFLDIENRLDQYKLALENTSKHIINLIVIFLFQTVLLPLIFLFLVYKLCLYLLTIENI